MSNTENRETKPRGRPKKTKSNLDQNDKLDKIDNLDKIDINPKIKILSKKKKNISILSWNINGIRSILSDHVKVEQSLTFQEYLLEKNQDIICFSETRISKQKDIDKIDSEILQDYRFRYWNCSKVKHGYSGTAIFSKLEPNKCQYGLPDQAEDPEGRVITLFFSNFILVNVYTPNSGERLVRLDYRVSEWDLQFRNYITSLEKILPVIICGDLNCAHQEIDIHNPKSNLRNSGFTIEERNSFDLLLGKNLIDTFRMFYPNQKKYTFWSFKRNSRVKNIGWRIDYFLVSKKLKNKLISSEIEDKVMGSDHAPIFLKLLI